MIIQKENKILRQSAKRVADAASADIKTLIKKMAGAMFGEPDGVGIAAPQVGEDLRIFLVAKDTLNHQTEEGKHSAVSTLAERNKHGYLVFINPVLKKSSQKKSKDTEGCLSVRGVYGEVARPEKVIVEYLDENGRKQSRGASGLFARIIQHELDHLNGVLFVDKAKNIKHVNMKYET